MFECKNVNNGSVMTETTTTASPNVHIFEIISDKKKASLTLKYASLWFTWIKLRGIRNLFFVNHHSHSNGFYWGRQCSLTSPQPTACTSTITTATEVTRLKAMFNPTLPGNFPSGCPVLSTFSTWLSLLYRSLCNYDYLGIVFQTYWNTTYISDVKKSLKMYFVKGDVMKFV